MARLDLDKCIVMTVLLSTVIGYFVNGRNVDVRISTPDGMLIEIRSAPSHPTPLPQDMVLLHKSSFTV
jgi:hypothetical protein